MYLLLILACWLFPTSSTPTSNHSLKVKVTNLQSKKGTIRVGLCNDRTQWLSKSFAAQNFKVEGQNNCTLVFENIPSGTYAISIYHDENDNSELDLGLLKLPKEPYGFSNNPSTMFGPPSFEEASFQVDNNLTITIKF
ncbi:MAG: DUF2141 domain-containing protein [Bacteroidota bacterium]